MGRPVTEPVIAFESPAAWEAWLAEHHATLRAVWVKIAKKSSGIPTVTFPEALEGALCYGWIDGQRNRFDDLWFVQRFTARRLAEVERARADGRWDAAYDPPSALTVPPVSAEPALEPRASGQPDEMQWYDDQEIPRLVGDASFAGRSLLRPHRPDVLSEP